MSKKRTQADKIKVSIDNDNGPNECLVLMKKRKAKEPTIIILGISDKSDLEAKEYKYVYTIGNDKTKHIESGADLAKKYPKEVLEYFLNLAIFE